MRMARSISPRKAGDRFFPDFAGRRSEVDEIAVVNDQRLEIVKLALFG